MHPTFNVERLNKYLPATLHALAPMSNGGSHKLIVLVAVPISSKTSVAVAPLQCMYQNLAFQVHEAFEQLAIRLSNLLRGSSCLCSTLEGSLSIQLSFSCLLHSSINVVLRNQDASLTFVRVHHRSKMRRT